MKYIKTFESKEVSFFEITKEESWILKHLPFNERYANLIVDLFTKNTRRDRFRSFRNIKNHYSLILTLHDGLSTYTIKIQEQADEWFSVIIDKKQPVWPNNENFYYKCDQIEGVVELLISKNFLTIKRFP